MFYNHLYDYLNRSKLLFSKPSGFRLLHSVVTCLLNCKSDWYLNTDKGHYTTMIFIYLKKTYDSVLKKLEKYGDIGHENTWFASCLCHSVQFRRVNGVSSGLDNIHFGVPKGSFLGHLLPLIYMYGLLIALQSSQVTRYADDTTLSPSFKSIGNLSENLNRDLCNLKQWLQENKL